MQQFLRHGLELGVLVAPPGMKSDKCKGIPKNVDEYLAGVSKSARSNFDKIRAAIPSAVPAEAIETISYGIPAFKHTRVLVWFAAFSNHCSLFPLPRLSKRS
jgi:hypothetical protein